MGSPRDEIQLQRRRSALIGGAVLAVLLIVGIVVAVSGGSDGGGATATTPAPAQAPPAAGRRVTNGRLGASIRLPAGWRSQVSRAAIALRSGDRSTAIAVSRPGGAGRSAALLQAGVRDTRNGLRDATVEAGNGRQVAGLPTVSAVVRGTNARGSRVSVLVAAAQGRRRAWLVEVLSAADRRGGSGLVEAQVALGTLRLSG